MKKFLLIIFSTLFLIGCNTENIQYISFTSKPSLSYYTDKIRLLLANNKDYSIILFNKNLFRTTPLDDNQKLIIENFLDYLPNDNYKEYYDIEKKEIYQLRLTIDNQKYIIKIFDYTLISIAPYDGNYEEDIIVMDNIPIRYNLYDYCYYIENNYKLNQ